MVFFRRFAAFFADCAPSERVATALSSATTPFFLLLVTGSSSVVSWGAESGVSWKIAVDVERRFRVSYENSQRLEILDFEKKPIRDRPEVDLTRRLDVDLRLLWTSVRRNVATGVLRVEKIRSVQLQDFNGESHAGRDLEVKLELKRGKSLAVQKLDLEPAAVGELRRYLQDAARVREFRDLLRESLDELCHYFPSTDRPGVAHKARPGTTWKHQRTYPLERRKELRARMELEYLKEESRPVGAGGGDAKVAVIEGSISQQIPDAPPRVQNDPGLFPGKIAWTHDLEKDFPLFLEAEKIARIPVPDRRLPIVKTLTHTYRLRVGDPKAFPKEKVEE